MDLTTGARWPTVRSYLAFFPAVTATSVRRLVVDEAEVYEWPHPISEALWDRLELLLGTRQWKGTVTRTNITDAPQDASGHLLEPVMSDVVRSGEIFDLVRQMLPGVDKRWLTAWPVLKGRDKLYKSDRLWAHMMMTLNWKFVPSI